MKDKQDPLIYRSLIVLKDRPGASAATALDAPDRRDGLVYDYDQELKLAAEVALVSGRPLLLRGEPGTGKSSFAGYVARNLGRRYYEHVVTARTRARDLLWTYDSVRRLADAQVRRRDDPPLNDYDYVEPGALWWVIDRDSAQRRGAPEATPPSRPATEPNAEFNADRSRDHAVVLLDEIDKADPDVPNSLLVPLGSLEFQVEETGAIVRRAGREDDDDPTCSLLVVITTNEERSLPDAFLRRCVVYKLGHPDHDRLVRIARLHFGGPELQLSPRDLELCAAIARRIEELRGQAGELGVRAPSTAEYLDAVRACRSLDIYEVDAGSRAWQEVERLVLRKLRLSEEPEDGLEGFLD